MASCFSSLRYFLTLTLTLLATAPSASAVLAPVHLVGDPSEEAAEKSEIGKLVDQLHLKIARPADFPTGFQEIQQSVAALLRTLVEEGDGPEPISLAILDSREIQASFIRSGGRRILAISMGALAAAKDDSQLAFVLGHELEHGASQIEEFLKYHHRDSIFSHIYAGGMEKAVENEVDVKSLINRVHRKGLSAAMAIDFFAQLEKRFGDAFNFSHPLIMQRVGVLERAATALTRGRGEVLRTDPVNRVLNSRWNQFFDGNAYNRQRNQRLQALLKKTDRPQLEEILGKIRDGTLSPEASSNSSRNPRSIVNRLISERWSEVAPLIADRPLADQIVIGERLRVQLLREIGEAKKRVFGPDFQPRSLNEALYFYEFYKEDIPNPATYRIGYAGTTEELVSQELRSLDRASAELASASRASANAMPAYERAAKVAAAEDQISTHESHLQALSRIYDFPRDRSFIDFAGEYLPGEGDRHSYNTPGWKAEAETQQALMRKLRRISGASQSEIIQDQVASVRGLQPFLAELPASLLREDASDSMGIGNRIFEAPTHFLRSQNAHRQLLAHDFPLAIVQRLAHASHEEAERIHRFLERNYFDKVGDLLTNSKTREYFSEPDFLKAFQSMLQSHNDFRIAHGNPPLEVVPDSRSNGIMIHKYQHQISLPQDLAAKFHLGSGSPFDRALESFLRSTAAASNISRVSFAPQDFFDQHWHEIRQQPDVEWLKKVRDAMAKRYQELIPGLLHPAELAEAVLSVKFVQERHPFHFGSEELLRRLVEASGAVAALPKDKRGVLLGLPDLFTYLVENRNLDPVSVFSAMDRMGEALNMHRGRDGENYVYDTKYQGNLKIRRAYARWAAEHSSSRFRQALDSIEELYTQRQGERYSADEGEALREEGAIARELKSASKFNWERMLERGFYWKYDQEEFWEEFTRNPRERLQEVLAYLDACEAKAVGAKGGRAQSSWIQYKPTAITQEFLEQVEPVASGEDWTRILGHLLEANQPSPQRDRVFELAWKASQGKLPPGWKDKRAIQKLFFNDNKILLARAQLTDRFPSLATGATSGRAPSEIRKETQAIAAAIQVQFPSPSFSRNQLLDWVEKRLLTTPAEHSVFSKLWVNQDNWYGVKGVAIADSLEAISARLENNAERIDTIQYITQRRTTLPQSVIATLTREMHGQSDLEKAFHALDALRTKFQGMDPFERSLAIYPFLGGEHGVLALPETAAEIRKMILGKNSQDPRFQAFFKAYIDHSPAHEKNSILAYMIGATAGHQSGEPGAVLRMILEAMPPLGPRAGQAIRSSGRAPEEFNRHLTQLLDNSLVPTQERIHADVKRIFGANAKHVRVGRIRGSGSVNYVLDVDVQHPTTGKWEAHVLKVRRARIGELAAREDDIWKNALRDLRSHPDLDVQIAASITDDARHQAVERLRPGGVELSQPAEQGLHRAGAATVYDTPQSRAMRPSLTLSSLIDPREREGAGIYERIEGKALHDLESAADRKEMARFILERELRGIFELGVFDADPQLGNWLKETSSGHYVRLDYAQLTRIRNVEELGAFKSSLALLTDPRFSEKDLPGLAALWEKLAEQGAASSPLVSELRTALKSTALPAATSAWDRWMILQFEVNRLRRQNGRPDLRFKPEISSAWAAIRKLGGLKGEQLGAQEFFELFNRHLKLPILTQLRLAQANGISGRDLVLGAVDSCVARFGKLLRSPKKSP